jgi:hypothetical protein
MVPNCSWRGQINRGTFTHSIGRAGI